MILLKTMGKGKRIQAVLRTILITKEELEFYYFHTAYMGRGEKNHGGAM